MGRLFGLGFLLLLTGSLAQGAQQTQGYQSLTLLGREHGTAIYPALSDADIQALRERSVIILGTSLNDSPPFDISSSHKDYEGITADYAELIADALRIRFDVRRYASRSDALRALQAGEIDMLGSAVRDDAAMPGIVLSRSYLDDQLVVVAPRAKAEPAHDLAGLRLAMVRHRANAERVRELYPEAELLLYPTSLDAIGAAAFGQADVFIGGATTANYLINRNLLNDLQVVDFARFEPVGVGFAMRANDEVLRRVVDVTLAAIPSVESMNIARRWGHHAVTMHGADSFELSEREERWLATGPKLKVAMPQQSPPLTFTGEDGGIRGISIDVLEQIGRRTGLRFEVVAATSADEALNMLRQGKVDAASVFQAGVEGQGELHSTRPYLSSPFVLVTRDEADAPATLADMRAMRVAIPADSQLHDYVVAQYPGISVVETADARSSAGLVANGQADGAVTTLIDARYMLANTYPDRLRIAATLGGRSDQVGFVMRRDSIELYSIMDKALISFPPDGMKELIGRWQNEFSIAGVRIHPGHVAFLQGLSVVVALLVFVFGWNTYLRRLVRRRERAEQALQEQMEFMRVMIDALPHPVYVRDSESRLLLCNTSYLDALGVSREQVIGMLPLEGMGTDSACGQFLEEHYLTVMQEGKEVMQDCRLHFPGGRTITAYQWILPFRDRRDQVKGIIAGWIDISERERLLVQLKEAKQEADRANRAKTTFLAAMSHEIRTPMNAVVGMLELTTKKAEQGILDRFAIEVASGAAQDLLDLIGNILDIVRIESGKLSITPKRSSLKEVVEAVLRVFEGVARQKGLELTLDFSPAADREVMIDPLRFKQVLSNLLSNAIKFTRVGSVRVCVTATVGRAPDILDVRLDVSDTGVGIAPEAQQRLFSPFAQAGEGAEAGGSGLGLSISRKICTLMKGELRLTSEPGKGTRVDVHMAMPLLDPPETLSPDTATILEQRSLSILIADDYSANRLLLSQQLEYLGHRVREAEDGVQALCLWGDEHFDVVITDCAMPRMNGYDLAGNIRAQEAASGRKACVILGFTANAQPQEVERCRSAGMNDCMFKPIKMQDLALRLSTSSHADVERIDEGEEQDERMIDVAFIRQISRGSVDSVRNLLADLQSSNEKDIELLQRLSEEGNHQEISVFAHKVKGGARIVRAQALARCCDWVQSECAEGNPQGVTEAIESLDMAMRMLGEELQALMSGEARRQ